MNQVIISAVASALIFASAIQSGIIDTQSLKSKFLGDNKTEDLIDKVKVDETQSLEYNYYGDSNEDYNSNSYNYDSNNYDSNDYDSNNYDSNNYDSNDDYAYNSTDNLTYVDYDYNSTYNSTYDDYDYNSTYNSTYDDYDYNSTYNSTFDDYAYNSTDNLTYVDYDYNSTYNSTYDDYDYNSTYNSTFDDYDYNSTYNYTNLNQQYGKRVTTGLKSLHTTNAQGQVLFFDSSLIQLALKEGVNANEWKFRLNCVAIQEVDWCTIAENNNGRFLQYDLTWGSYPFTWLLYDNGAICRSDVYCITVGNFDSAVQNHIYATLVQGSGIPIYVGDL